MEDANGITAAAIDKIVALADERRKATFERGPGEPKNTYWLIKPDGSVELQQTQAERYSPQLERPKDVVEFFAANIRPVESAVAFYDRNFLTMLCDSRDPGTRVDCPLRLSPQWRWLLERSASAYAQRDFVRILRIDFRGCLDGAPSLLGLVRNLKFTSGTQAAGEIQHGRESLGRQIESQVSGAATIPEEVTLFVPVWENHHFRAGVACALEVMTDSATFRLTPYPMELENAIGLALDSLGDMLFEAEIPAFRGAPMIGEQYVGSAVQAKK